MATMSLTVSAILPSTDAPAKWKPAASAMRISPAPFQRSSQAESDSAARCLLALCYCQTTLTT